MNILTIGDVVGKPGRGAVKGLLSDLKKEFLVDLTIINAENSAAGSGLTSKLANELFDSGADVLTLGDHVWDQKELEPFLDSCPELIRPGNFPGTPPGKGWCIYSLDSDKKVAVINLLGRTFMRYQVECPFRSLESILEEVRSITPIIILDFHAETTSEKVAMGHFANGKVTAMVGTHTHIQTADEKVLSEGTAYITDLGMTGPYDSVIGQNKENILERFLTSRPIRFKVASGDVKLCGAIIQVEDTTGRASSITRIMKSFNPVME